MRSSLGRHVIGASCLALLTLGGLTGCSDDDDEPDGGDTAAAADDAHQEGCRTFLVTVGRDDLQAVLLLSRAERTGSYTPDDITGVLDSTNVAVARAGLVEDLSDDDFDRFREVADASHGARLAVTADEVELSERTVSTLEAAVTGLRESCEA